MTFAALVQLEHILVTLGVVSGLYMAFRSWEKLGD